MAGDRRLAGTGDMVRSLLVLLIPLLIITALFTRLPTDHPVKTVDWQPLLATARAEAPFAVLAPTNLPDGWRATSASWLKRGAPDANGTPSARNLWQLGLLTPQNLYLGLIQGDGDSTQLIKDKLPESDADGESTVGGTVWKRLLSTDGRTRSLVRVEPADTAIVTGDLSYEALEAYVGTFGSS